MGTSRHKVAVVAVGGHLYVLGAADDQHNVLMTIDCIDLDGGAWPLLHLAAARYGAVAVAAGGRLYIWGGRGADRRRHPILRC